MTPTKYLVQEFGSKDILKLKKDDPDGLDTLKKMAVEEMNKLGIAVE